MYCPKCGAENPDVAKFCGSCSSAMPGAQTVQPQYHYSAPAPGAQGTVTQGMKWGVGIASVLIPLLGFIMGIVYMLDPLAEKKAVGKLWLILACAGMAMYCFFGMVGNMAQRM